MRCPICKHAHISKFKQVKKITIFCCDACGHGFVDPKTKRSSVKEIYNPDAYKKKELQLTRRYNSIVSQVKRLSPGKKVLDVGGGFGLLASMLFKHKYTIDLLEPLVNPYYAKDNTYITIFKQTLEQFIQKTRKKYDLICAIDVIEHFDEPDEMLQSINTLAKRDTIICVQTPNYRSFMQYCIPNWAWWMIEDHRHFFSTQSLHFLMQKHGWKKVQYYTYEDKEDFVEQARGVNSKGFYFFFVIPFYVITRRLIGKWGWGGLHIGFYKKI